MRRRCGGCSPAGLALLIGALLLALPHASADVDKQTVGPGGGSLAKDSRPDSESVDEPAQEAELKASGSGDEDLGSDPVTIETEAEEAEAEVIETSGCAADPDSCDAPSEEGTPEPPPPDTAAGPGQAGSSTGSKAIAESMADAASKTATWLSTRAVPLAFELLEMLAPSLELLYKKLEVGPRLRLRLRLRSTPPALHSACALPAWPRPLGSDHTCGAAGLPRALRHAGSERPGHRLHGPRALQPGGPPPEARGRSAALLGELAGGQPARRRVGGGGRSRGPAERRGAHGSRARRLHHHRQPSAPSPPPPPRPPIGSPPAAGEGYWAGGGEGRDGGRVCVGWGVPWVFFADRLCTGVQCCGRSGARPGPGRCCLRRSSSTSGSWSPLPPPPPDQITHPNQTHDHHQPAFAHLPAPPLQRARAPPARVTTGDDRLLLRSGQRPRSAIPTPRRPPPSGCATGACSPGHRLRSPPGPVAPRKPNTSRLRPAVLLCTY